MKISHFQKSNWPLMHISLFPTLYSEGFEDLKINLYIDHLEKSGFKKSFIEDVEEVRNFTNPKHEKYVESLDYVKHIDKLYKYRWLNFLKKKITNLWHNKKINEYLRDEYTQGFIMGSVTAINICVLLLHIKLIFFN